MTKNEKPVVDGRLDKSRAEKRTLEPFVHQVSGRAHMLTLNADTLCKSLSKREWSFYNRIPTSLRQFTPRLKGLLFVHLVKENCSSHRFIASDVWAPLNHTYTDDYSCKASKNSTINGNTFFTPAQFHDNVGPEWRNGLEQTLFKGLERIEYNGTDGFTEHAWTVDKDQEAATVALGRNPWSSRQHQREINRMLKGDILRKEVDMLQLCEEIGMENRETHFNNEQFTKPYLLLDDITHTFKFPTILDLKIGTQLDRPGCSPAKKDKHFNLVQKSSTGSLGLRLAGMQVYQVNTREYLCRDKYYGRGLSTKGFVDALTQYLHNGDRIVTEAVAPIVNRLKELRSELEQQHTFRFHASSVLIIYESAFELSNDENSSLTSRQEKSPDGSTVSEVFTNRPCPESVDGVKDQNENSLNSTKSYSSCHCSVHMIDFAHCTFEGFLEDKTVYQGPDNDCLYALDNLISVLNNILKNAQTTS